MMKKYEIIGRYIQLFDGVVAVTEAQAKRRSASLHPLGDGIYRIDNPVQFKVGEIIGINYDPPKSLVDFMRLIEELPEPEEMAEELPEDKPFERKHKK